MFGRRIPVLIAIAAFTAALGADPQPTPIVPAAPVTDSMGLWLAFGLAQQPEGTDAFKGELPTFAGEVGVSFPIQGKAYVDLDMYFSVGSLTSNPYLSSWGNYATLGTLAFTASGRMGHTGKKVAVFGSAGLGIGRVALSVPSWIGFYLEVDSVWTPAVTVAGSLEAPSRSHNRFLAEFRYSWIEADFGSIVGGSVNAGGAALMLGYRHVF